MVIIDKAWLKEEKNETNRETHVLKGNIFIWHIYVFFYKLFINMNDIKSLLDLGWKMTFIHCYLDVYMLKVALLRKLLF